MYIIEEVNRHSYRLLIVYHPDNLIEPIATIRFTLPDEYIDERIKSWKLGITSIGQTIQDKLGELDAHTKRASENPAF